VTPKLTGMANQGSVAAWTRDCQGGRESKENVVVGVAETTVPGGGIGRGGESIGSGNNGGGWWGEEANGI
jgi:hypothetical protein